MTSNPSSLEAQLRELQAATLDDSFLLRLEAAADGSLTQLTPDELRFEAMLRETPPAKLSAGFLAQLESIVHEIPFAVDEKIVLFPKGNASEPTRRHRPIWGAAAAVALIGAATALLVPSANRPSSVARQSAPPSSSSAATPAGNFIPAGFNRGVSEVRDEGIVWKANRQPHNVVRVVYMDKITLKDANGRTVEVEQPRIEYMLVPAKTD